MKKRTTRGPKKLTGEIFDSLPSSEKERIYREFERLTPEQIDRQFRSLAPKERAGHMRPRKPGRPKLGKGVKVISLSVEKDLLKQADAYAKQHGLKRTQLFSLGLRLALSDKGLQGNHTA
ncbi:MAG TPA: hypothetical protein VN541_14765 [Tepidisphaeraceae bacterium]|nr:hypothetical protein [Tepidisphaeraceae bacterium]